MENNLARRRTIADEFLQLLTFEASDAAFCDGAYGDNAGRTHEDRHFTGELTGETATKHMALADDVFDGFSFTFEDDEEARLFPFTDEPLAGLEVNVGRASREPASFLFFNTRKNGDLFEFSGSNHCVILAAKLHAASLVKSLPRTWTRSLLNISEFTGCQWSVSDIRPLRSD